MANAGSRGARPTRSPSAVFCGSPVDEPPPDHSTISRTRRLIDLETHRAVFTWVQQRLVEAGLLKGRTIAIDATTLEANAAMRSIVRRDTGESYEAFLTGLAQASGIETPTREDLARLDRKRKKKTSNKDWTNPHDPDAKVTKMKDGRTHLAHKAEHAVDLETGAIVAVTLQGADDRRHDDDRRDGDGRGGSDRRRAGRRRRAAGAGRDHCGQGLSQQSDDGRPRRRGHAVLHRGAGSGTTRLVEGARGPGAGVSQSSPHPWTTRTAADASTRRDDRTLVRACL